MATQHSMLDNCQMTYARDEAIKLIEWLLPELRPGDALAVEMPFLDVRRKADVMAVGVNRLSAIEIKGPRDNFRRLAEQLDDYRRMFLDVSLAVPEQHLAAARELVSRDIGIILLGDSSASWVRMPRRRRRLKPDSAVRWLDSTDLAALVGSSIVRGQGIEEARRVAIASNSEAKLTDLALRAVIDRCHDRFTAFLQEKGPAVDLDDLQLLALSSKLRVQPKHLPRQMEIDPNGDPK